LDRAEVGELFYIAPIDNVPSILRLGLLSDRRAAKVPHVSVASTLIKTRRAPKPVSRTRTLPDYVNLYFCARNKMMFGLVHSTVPAESLCVLRIATEVLDLSEAVIADGNASSDYTRFDPVPTGLARLDAERIHAEWWTRYDDDIEKWEHGRVKNSELLIPDFVPPSLITGALVATDAVAVRLRPVMTPRAVLVAPYVFFAGPRA
jgi:hypothetical protein